MSLLRSLRIGVASLALFQFAIGNSVAGPPPQGGTEDGNTVTPIKHVIVIVGENRSFDHLFANYVPKAGETVKNLFSEGIVNADGTRGPNFSRAIQYSADITGATSFQLSPTSKTPYAVLPVPLTGGPSNVYKDNGMCKLTDAKSPENGLPRSPTCKGTRWCS